MTAAERVAAGAALLDREKPGWASLIDLEGLEMDVGCRCVLGQLEGSYRDALVILDLKRFDNWSGGVDPADCGFTIRRGEAVASWDALDAAWRVEVLARVA